MMALSLSTSCVGMETSLSSPESKQRASVVTHTCDLRAGEAETDRSLALTVQPA